MPSIIRPPTPKNGLTKFTNCRILRGLELVQEDLWVSSLTGKIIASQAAFYDELSVPDEIVDLGGRILAPGMIDCQLNGAFGFSFSTLLDDASQYEKKLKEINHLLVATGVTSYLPTLTTQRAELYQQVSMGRETLHCNANWYGSLD
jgi:N-acetylglucosamine-6-phosphate deacetylase